MRLTPPTRYVFFSSVVLAIAALAFYVLDLLAAFEGAMHFAFWAAFVAWLALMAGAAAKGV